MPQDFDVEVEDYTRFPVSIDWGRSDSERITATSAAGSCSIIPIKTDLMEVHYVLLDSGGSKVTSEYIQGFLTDMGKNGYTPKIVGVIVTHFHTDHINGMVAMVKEKKADLFKDLLFFVHGDTSYKSKKDQFVSFCFGEEEMGAVVLKGNSASKRVFELSYGKILVRKWDKDESSQDRYLVAIVRGGLKSSGPDAIPLHLPLVGAGDDKEVEEDRSEENLSSVITVFLGDYLHYVFTGDSVLQLVREFVEYLPRTPKMKNEMLGLLQSGIKKPGLGDTYDLLFDYSIHVNYDSKSKYHIAFQKCLGDQKFEVMEMAHHGSIKNGILGRKARDAYEEEFGKKFNKEKETINWLNEEVSKISIEYFKNLTENLFTTSAGTKFHMDYRWFKVAKGFQLIVSYPTFFSVANLGMMGNATNYEEHFLKRLEERTLTVLVFQNDYQSMKCIPIANYNIMRKMKGSQGLKSNNTISTLDLIKNAPQSFKNQTILYPTKRLLTSQFVRRKMNIPLLSSYVDFEVSMGSTVRVNFSKDDLENGCVEYDSIPAVEIAEIVLEGFETVYDFYIHKSYFENNNPKLYSAILHYIEVSKLFSDDPFSLKDPSLIFRMGDDRVPKFIGLLFNKSKKEKTLETIKAINLSTYLNNSNYKTKYILEFFQKFDNEIMFSYCVEVPEVVKSMINRWVSGTTSIRPAVGVYSIYSPSNQPIPLSRLFNLAKFEFEKKIFGFSKLKFFEHLTNIASDLSLAHLEGYCYLNEEYKDNIFEIDQESLVKPQHFTSVSFKVQYRPTNNSLFKFIKLDNVSLSIGYHKHENHWELEDFIVGGLFKFSETLSIQITLDLNIGQECFAIHFYQPQDQRISLKDMYSQSMNSIESSKDPGDTFDFSKVPLLGDLNSFPIQSLSIYMSKDKYKFAGFNCLLNFDLGYQFGNNIYLNNVICEIEHLNRNSQVRSTTINTVFNFNIKSERNNEMTPIGSLYLSFNKGSRESEAKATVKLEKNTSIHQLLTYFIGDYGSVLDDCPIIDLKNIAISEIGLSVNITQKIVNEFHFDVNLINPIQISSNISFSLSKFTLNYNNSTKSFAIYCSAIINQKTINLKIIREKGKWRFIFDYYSDKPKELASYNNMIASLENDNFFDKIFNEIHLNRVHLSYSQRDKSAMFYTEVNDTKLALLYYQGKINIFLNLNFKFGSRSEVLDNLGDCLNYDITKSIFGGNDLELKFVRTANYDDRAQFLSQLTIDDEITQLMNLRNVEAGLVAVGLVCKPAFFKELMYKMTKESSDKEITFVIKYHDKVFSLLASFECGIEIGEYFKLNTIEIGAILQTGSASLELKAKGQFKTRQNFNGNLIEGILKLNFGKSGFSLGLALKAKKWFQPFSIEWLHVEEVSIAASANPTTVISELGFTANLAIISLEDQKAIKTSSSPDSIINQYPKPSSGKFEISFYLNLDLNDYYFKFMLQNLKLDVVFRDICKEETNSEFLKAIDIRKLLFEGAMKKKTFSFCIELDIQVNDFNAYLKVYLNAMNPSFLAMGRFSRLSFLNDKVIIDKCSNILSTAGITVDPEIIRVEKEISDYIDKNHSGDYNMLLHKLQEVEIKKQDGPMFKFVFERSNSEIKVSAGMKILEIYGAATIAISKNQFFVYGLLQLGGLKINVSSQLTKSSFRFTSEIHWNLSFTTPEISIGSVRIFPSINVTTSFDGVFDFFVSQSDCYLSIQVEFNLGPIHLKVPRFTLRLSNLLELAYSVILYIIENFFDLMKDFLSQTNLGKFFFETIPKIFDNIGKSLTYFAKELGHSIVQVKDWLVAHLSPEAIKEYLVTIYKFASEAIDAICGFASKVIDTVVNWITDAACAIGRAVANFFSSLFSNDPNRPKLNWSIEGIYVSEIPPDDKLDTFVFDENVTSLLDNINIFFNNNTKPFISHSFNTAQLKTEYIEKIQIINNSISESIKQFSELNANVKGSELEKKVEASITPYLKALISLDDLINDIIKICFEKNSINDMFAYMNQNMSTGTTDETKKLTSPFVSQVISVLKFLIVSLNYVNPLFKYYQGLVQLYFQTPENILKYSSKLVVLRHVNSMLSDSLGSNGFTFHDNQGNHYIILDSRVHMVPYYLINQSGQLRNIGSESDKIQHGIPLNEVIILKCQEKYYLSLIRVVREIPSDMHSSFNLKLANVKPNLISCYEANQISKTVSYLEGFPRSPMFTPKGLTFEVGIKNTNDLLYGSIIQVYGKSKTYNLLVVSRELIFLIDDSTDVWDNSIVQFLDQLNYKKPYGRKHFVFTLILEDFKTLEETIMLIKSVNATLKSDCKKKAPIEKSLLTSKGFNPKNTYEEYFKFDSNTEYISGEPKPLPKFDISEQDLEQLPKFSHNDSFGKLDVGQFAKDQERKSQYFWVNDRFMFPINFVPKIVNVLENDKKIHSTILLKQNIILYNNKNNNNNVNLDSKIKSLYI